MCVCVRLYNIGNMILINIDDLESPTFSLYHDSSVRCSKSGSKPSKLMTYLNSVFDSMSAWEFSASALIFVFFTFYAIGYRNPQFI